MAYDEHYSGSKKAGSNSSISFVKTGISDTLKEVPKDELILALPFYTRVFTVNSSNAVVSSKALGMKAASDLVESWGTEKTWDEKKDQYFASVENSDGTKSEVWLEDARSLGLKLDEMKENKLAGAAFWKSGFETSDIWDTVTPYIN
jgi:spore germination protein YaaH